MARKAIEIPIGADTGAFEKGMSSGVIEPLKDAEKALEDLADAKGPRQLEAELKDAQRQTEKLKDETRETADAIERSWKGAYRKVKEESADSTRKVKEGFTEAKDEANSSGREAAASFGGGFEDVADFVQETLANALSGFGPVGAAAGIALAAVLGTALANAEAAQDKLNDAREAAAELAAQLYENGGELPLQDKVDQLFETLSKESKANGALQSMIDQWADFGTVLDDLKGSASAVNRPVSQLIDALGGGDLDQAREMLARVNEELDAMSDWTPVWDEQYQSLNGYKNELEQVIKATEMADELNRTVSETGVAAAQAQADAAEDQAERVNAATESVRQSAAGAYDSMRDKAYEKATADDAAFDLDRWLTYVEETRAQADAYRANLQAMQLTPDEWSNLLSLPEDARATIAASYASAGDEGKARIRAALGDGGGGEAGSEATVAFDDSFNPAAKVTPKVDGAPAEAAMKELTRQREVVVKVKVDRSELDALPTRRTITIDADTSSARRTVDQLNGRTVTVNVEGRKVGAAWQ
ncbi:hypothetical protein SAMN04487848_2051 [Microbacterium sp. ru370.1]|nr:hypothetical protein SAMN04487848_2051 [Microbacterium sp. ru370.1]SIT88899.1 hypothetical protein SAMN05880579_2046 [Microbacterium sp. RU1D]